MMRRHNELGRVDFAKWLRQTIKVMAAGIIVSGALVYLTSPANAFPWSIDMYRGPAIQPLEVAPRVMPDGVLPVDGIHYNVHYGQPKDLPGSDQQGLPPMKLEAMTVRMHNPLRPTVDNLQRGANLFAADCSPCHGPMGRGDGTVVHLLAHKPADLLTGVSKNLPDGYIYGYIRNGGIWMPAYADAMSSDERWQVVMYLRKLQDKYGGEEASAPPTAPEPPATSEGTGGGEETGPRSEAP
jgi:mono/diheme cytochrome c family protein